MPSGFPRTRTGAGHQRVADAACGTAEPQAGGLLQRFSLPSGQLENSKTSGGEGGVSCGGVVPTSGLHRDQPGDGQPGCGALLQQARHGGAMDQRRQAVKMTRLSCHHSRSNEVRLWLSVLAYNLGNLWRRLVLPKRIDHWSLTSLQQRLVKTGGRLIKHARYYWLLLAESHLTRRLFAGMLRKIAALPSPAGCACQSLFSCIPDALSDSLRHSGFRAATVGTGAGRCSRLFDGLAVKYSCLEKDAPFK